MAIICSKYHSTRDFSFHADLRCFTVEASTLSKGLRRPHDGRVYDDACDVGFVLVSHTTGNSILFVQDGTDMNGGDVAGWRYKAIKQGHPNRPQCWSELDSDRTDLTALIIND